MRFLGKSDGGEGEEEAVASVELIVVNCFFRMPGVRASRLRRVGDSG